MGAYDKALSILTLREHSSKELRDKLIAKGYSSGETDSAIKTLEEEGYLSDERFTECFLRSSLKKRAEGKSILIMRLVDKGVDRSLAAGAVEDVWGNEDYLPVLRKEKVKLEKKHGKDGAVQRLLRKGFTMSEIRKAEEKDNEE